MSNARIPATGWLSERLSNSLSIHSNGGWFDIPNGWTADSAGIVCVAGHSGDQMDLTLYVDDVVDSSTSGSGGPGWAHCTLVSRGSHVRFYIAKANLDYFRFMRLH
ncbi:TPA: hypothetical protein H1V70_000122 [Salmonella enterica]|nr:hypothetical protein [Salmonella enterica]